MVSDPNICGGAPVFKGTRVLLRTILASLAEGDDPEELLKDFSTLSMEDLRAAMDAASAVEDIGWPRANKIA
ncbi:MAG: DUF433 domain-containing protein [Magnetococcales bacterium]|nr:DUF433 domain-containing protein [Magnetococcales bacterium]